MWQLIIFKDGQCISERVLAPGEYLLGRSPDSDLILDDRQVSRQHARMTITAQGARFQDLGSVNRLVLDGQEADQVELGSGQSVTIRPFVLTLQALDQEDRTVIMDARDRNDDQQHTVVMSARQPQTGPAKPPVAAIRPASRLDRRTLLYGLLGFALLGIIATFLFSSGDQDPAPQGPPARPAATSQVQDRDLDQLQRMAAINLVKGKQALDAERYEDAVDFLHQAAVADPEHEEVRELLAQARGLLEQRQREQEILRQRRAIQEEEIDRLLADAQTAMQEDDHVLAKVHVLAALSLREDHDEARRMLEDVTQSWNELQETLRGLEEVVQEAMERGHAFLEQGELAKAALAWEAALEADPEMLSREAALAAVLIEEVREDLREQSAKLLRTAAERAKTAPRQAYDGLQTILEIDPWNEEAEQLRQDVLQRLVSEGRKIFDEGQVLDSLGERSKACAKWRHALQTVPESDALHQRIQERLAQCR